MSTTPRGRYWEIDALRGVAIIMMIIFHLGWDLHYFRLSAIDVFEAPWIYWGRATATLFLLLVGVSLQLSAERVRRSGGGETAIWQRQWRRGLTVFGAGLIVTIATYLAIGPGFVIFGILHLIGLAMLVTFPLLRAGWWNLVLAGLCLVVGQALAQVVVPFPWLLWLGLRPTGFFTVDYYPLLPWLAIVLIGLFLGERLARRVDQALVAPALAERPASRLLRWLGRHSLAIYLLHQPLLVVGLIATGRVPLSALTG